MKIAVTNYPTVQLGALKCEHLHTTYYSIEKKPIRYSVQQRLEEFLSNEQKVLDRRRELATQGDYVDHSIQPAQDLLNKVWQAIADYARW